MLEALLTTSTIKMSDIQSATPHDTMMVGESSIGPDDDMWEPTLQPHPLAQQAYNHFPPHPISLHESANMKLVPLPPLQPRDLLHPATHQLGDRGVLSLAQFEAACYAKRALRQVGAPAFFLGDATGVGKTRTVAAILVDDVLSTAAEVRVLWVSCRADLDTDVECTLRLIARECGLSDTTIQWCNNQPKKRKRRNQFGLPPEAAAAAAAAAPRMVVRFDTYAHIRSKAKGGAPSATIELAGWLSGAPRHFMVFDEAHFARKAGSCTQQAVMGLQVMAQSAKAIFVTATAASDVNNLAYMQRLGIFGTPSAPFPDYDTCTRLLRQSNLGALEMVAMFLKHRGVYVARSFSANSHQGDRLHAPPLVLPIPPSGAQTYDECCRLWHEIDVTHRFAVGQGIHTSTKQNFFLRLLANLKSLSLVPIVLDQVARGRSVIISLQSIGNGNSLANTLTKHGVSVAELALPADALDTLFLGLSPHVGVGEISGRTERTELLPDGTQALVRRSKADIKQDTIRFQQDTAQVVLVSAAGGLGLSLHAATPQSRPRLHMLLELPWGSEALVQQMGRSHRTGEETPPVYQVITMNVPVDLRVAQAVQHKMQSLSALTRGDRSNHKCVEHNSATLTPSVVKSAALELLLREARAFLHLPPQLELMHDGARRCFARQTLGVGSGWHHDHLVDRCARLLSNALNNWDLEQARRRELGASYEQAEEPYTTACNLWAATRVMFPSMTHLVEKGVHLSTIHQLPPPIQQIAVTVCLCARHVACRNTLGSLPPDLFESVLCQALDPDWAVPMSHFTDWLRRCNLSRNDLMSKTSIYARLCGAPIPVQRAYFGAVKRANECLRHIEECEEGKPAACGNATNAVDYLYPNGLPAGCQCCCTELPTNQLGLQSFKFHLELDPKAHRASRERFTRALAEWPTCRATNGGLPGRRFLYCSKHSKSLRLVVPMPTEKNGSIVCDYEIWAPGGTCPARRLVHETWNWWFRKDAGLVSPHLSRVQIEQAWDTQEQHVIAKRRQRCKNFDREVQILDCSRALHEWRDSHQVLLKFAPPFVKQPLIGVAV